MKESYIKLPNITTSKLQDVVDYLDENNIEYIEEYKRDEEIERLNNIINKAIEYINTMPLTKGTEWYRIQLLDILEGVDKE